jgi:hypothetical protein
MFVQRGPLTLQQARQALQLVGAQRHGETCGLWSRLTGTCSRTLCRLGWQSERVNQTAHEPHHAGSAAVGPQQNRQACGGNVLPHTLHEAGQQHTDVQQHKPVAMAVGKSVTNTRHMSNACRLCSLCGRNGTDRPAGLGTGSHGPAATRAGRDDGRSMPAPHTLCIAALQYAAVVHVHSTKPGLKPSAQQLPNLLANCDPPVRTISSSPFTLRSDTFPHASMLPIQP